MTMNLTNSQTPAPVEPDDDAPVGRVLGRREVLALFGFAGTALLAGCVPGAAPAATSTPLPAEAATAVALAADPTAQSVAVAGAATVEAANSAALPDCVVRPEMTEGPYFVNRQLNRADIRVEPSDGSVKEGIPLTLAFALSQVSNSACTPLAGAMVDVWHCDAAGVYSGVRDRSFDTTGQKWLRGYLLTDANGLAEFTTIYPGWYWVARCIFTSRSAQKARMEPITSSRRNSSSTRPRRTRSMRSHPTRQRESATHPMRAMAFTGTAARRCC